MLCGRHCVLRHTATQHSLPLLPASIASETKRAPDFEMFLLGRQREEKLLKFTVWVGNIYVTIKGSKWGYLNNRTQSSRKTYFTIPEFESLTLFNLQLWDLNALTKDETCAAAVGVHSPNHWDHQGNLKDLTLMKNKLKSISTSLLYRHLNKHYSPNFLCIYCCFFFLLYREKAYTTVCKYLESSFRKYDN